MTDASLRIAGAQDAAAIDAFLASYSATSMFLRGNLAKHGTDDRMAPHGTKFYLTVQVGQITAVFGITNSGYLRAQAPDAPDVAWAAFGRQIKSPFIFPITTVPRELMKRLGTNTSGSTAWPI